MPFRYTCSPSSKVPCFVPAPLPATVNLMEARYSQLGAGFIGKLHQLTSAPAALCKILFEARVAVRTASVSEVKLQTGMPATVTPIKPKLWLCCKVTIEPLHAVKVG